MPAATFFVLMNDDLVARPLKGEMAQGRIFQRPYYGAPVGFSFESVDLRMGLAADDCERMYAQSALGSRSSQRTTPPDSRSSRMQSSALNDWCLLTAFRRYPSVVPQAAAYDTRASLDRELRYLSNLSMDIIYPQVKSKSIPAGHLPLSKLLIECGMDKYEVRRLNLRAVVRTHCGDRHATLADKIGRSASYVSRMLYPEGKSGKKRIGEDMQHLIEDALSLERGRLDDAEAAARESGGQLAVLAGDDQSSGPAQGPLEQPQPDIPLVNASVSTETTLERLDANEKRLLELYRRSTENGKLMIYGAATVAPKVQESDLFGRSN